MEELSQMAKAYYQASSDHIQKLAHNFFGVMDHDGDGKIDRKEFLEFMKEEGYGKMTNPSFFNQVDLDRNGTLDFFEVMTVYYILKSGRPFCDHCNKFIPSTYLTCVRCLENTVGGSFYLCPDCYISQKCDHTHGGLSWFLDNYLLLEVKTSEAGSGSGSGSISSESRSRPYETIGIPSKPPPSNNHTLYSSLAMVPAYGTPLVHNHQYGPMVHNHTWIQNQNNYSYHYPPSRPIQYAGGAHDAIPQQQKWKVALEALEAAFYIGAVGSAASCSIL